MQTIHNINPVSRLRDVSNPYTYANHKTVQVEQCQGPQ